MSYTQHGDRPRVMAPLDLVVATARAKTALWAYIGIARHADNSTGRSSCTVEQIAETVGIGRTQASAGVNWLIDHGWVTRLVEGRKGAGSSLYEVHMKPVPEGQRPESRTLTSASGKPDHSVRKVERSLVSSLVTTTSSPNASGASGRPDHPDDGSAIPGLLVRAPARPDPKPQRKTTAYPEEFMRLWEAAPRRRGTERGSKPDALKEWRHALDRGVDNATLIAAARAYGRATDPRYVPDLCRWLKGELYEPYLEQAQRHTAGDPTDAELDAVLGKSLVTLPAPPPGVVHGSTAYREWKTAFFRDHRAERVRQYRARTTTRSIA